MNNLLKPYKPTKLLLILANIIVWTYSLILGSTLIILALLAGTNLTSFGGFSWRNNCLPSKGHTQRYSAEYIGNIAKNNIEAIEQAREVLGDRGALNINTTGDSDDNIGERFLCGPLINNSYIEIAFNTGMPAPESKRILNIIKSLFDSLNIPFEVKMGNVPYVGIDMDDPMSEEVFSKISTELHMIERYILKFEDHQEFKLSQAYKDRLISKETIEVSKEMVLYQNAMLSGDVNGENKDLMSKYPLVKRFLAAATKYRK